MWILVAGFRHGGDKFLPGVLLNTHAHFFAERDMIVPGLLQLRTPVTAMQNIVQWGHRFNHQKMAHRRGLRGGNFPLVHEAQLGEKRHGIFTCATGYALHAFLSGDRFQRHGDQCPQTFVLHFRMDSHKTNRRFVIGVDVQSPNSDQLSLFIHHHLMVRHRVPGVSLGAFRLMQRLTQHFPAKLVVFL